MRGERDAAALALQGHDLAKALRSWDLGDSVSWEPLWGGMNSATWLVRAGDCRFVAKAVPAQAGRQFEAGLLTALRLEAGGLAAGAPLATRDGCSSLRVAGHRLALLRFVEGRAIDSSDPDERRAWGAALGKAHRILLDWPPPAGVPSWHWVDPLAPHLDVEPWVRPAVQATVQELQRIEQVVPFTYGVLHADPAPEAFLLDESGQVAIIDWGSVTAGPLLYDVASSRLYNGPDLDFSAFLDGYLAAMPLSREQLAALPAFLRFRWAVQADYFARRIWRQDLTGIEGPAGNQRGLDDARRHLTATAGLDGGCT